MHVRLNLMHHDALHNETLPGTPASELIERALTSGEGNPPWDWLGKSLKADR